MSEIDGDWWVGFTKVVWKASKQAPRDAGEVGYESAQILVPYSVVVGS